MTNSAQEYADRLIDTILQCLAECAAADDTGACARDFVTRLRNDPAWHASDTDRVERAVIRAVELGESGGYRMWA
jgi:hypothetical protein